MRGSNAYLKLQTAFSMAQKAHTDGWEVAKASINSAAADFPTHFAAATEKAKEATAEGASWAREHPYKAAAYGTVGAVSLVTVAAPGAVAAPVLALGGFGSNGVIGGSLAAGIQSGIGNVIAPSLFATCQSAAAGGYGVAAVNAVVQAGGAVLGVGTAGTAVISERNKSKGKDEAEEEKENPKENEEENSREAETNGASDSRETTQS